MCCSTPQAPDYTAAAREQGAANIDAARVEGRMNRPDIYGPYGSQRWTDLGNDRFRLDEELSPGQQGILDRQTALSTGLLDMALGPGMSSVLEALRGSYSLSGNPLLDYDPRYAPTDRLQLDSGMTNAPSLQDSVDFSGAPPIPVADAESRRRVEDAIYNSAARYLEPQYDREQNELRTNLSNQGIFGDQEAYGQRMGDFEDQWARNFGDARDRAIMGGGEEMARQFNMGLAAHQTGVNDILSQGQFRNSARGQLISELLANMQARNNAIIGQGNMAAQHLGATSTARGNALAELTASRTMPINVMNSIRSGSQVNNPQFQPFNNNLQVAPPPLFQGALAQGQSALDAYNARQAGIGNWVNAIGRVASAPGMPWMS